MARLALVSLGVLGGALLEAVARRGVFEEILIATRNVEGAIAKANNARIGAALEGRYPNISVVSFDMHAADAASRIAEFGADVVFCTPSMMPWWKLGRLDGARRDLVRNAPFACFTACHLAPMLAFREAWSKAGGTGHWVSASSPDVVNPVLALTGEGPVCGTGNVAEVIPKIRFGLARELDARPEDFDVRLVAQHAFEYYCYHEVQVEPEDAPPFLLQACFEDRDLSLIAEEGLFVPYPIPYDLDFNLITVSATLPVLEGLCSVAVTRTHAPAPNGLPGGYPVKVSAEGVELDLAPDWAEEQAVAVNRAGFPFDGIENLEDDGTVVFTGPAVTALEEITGRRVERMRVDDVPALAARLTERLS